MTKGNWERTASSTIRFIFGHYKGSMTSTTLVEVDVTLTCPPLGLNLCSLKWYNKVSMVFESRPGLPKLDKL